MSLIQKCIASWERLRRRRMVPQLELLDRRIVDQILALNGQRSAFTSIREIVETAWRQGRAADLTNAVYGPTHWGEKFHAAPFPYYCFLNGLVRSQNCRRIFEIGTHYGGSTLAMLRGGADRIVTVDVTDLNPNLHRTDGIIKLTGDANSELLVRKAILEVGSEPIDIIYVDADHHFGPTLENIGLYSFLFRPRFVVIDDIVLNEDMRSLWHAIKAVYGGNAINCADIVPEIRDADVGFGLVRLNPRT